ncbi:hypothetical protein JAAARDRAFT_32094 [Jaapia argillacea MUCL 33604]|uniref:Peptidase M16 N-terminal domain-containing protein n=1 Tax=Jaapia argillacea MUCL 33604 TaxID=933084 RepID=A0A067Q1Z5_9AGAM|nr:hypothetical protein JAAARDRAFT_32094 [Jaapia argillacea MUCL 33604]
MPPLVARPFFIPSVQARLLLTRFATRSASLNHRAHFAMARDNIKWRRVAPAKDKVPPYSIFMKPIEKSQQDDREYRIVQLENGLQATVIHDASADKAAASLEVAVGHLYDPDDMPGLAHFCEHLLFMGTETYPRENEYSEYLSKNNGSSNAYTATSATNYYFNVATQALPGALSRFAAFFHCPLFAPSCTSRELNAVDSEHKKNHQQDMWRIFQLNKHLSKDGHVWKKFGSGNRESLSKHAKELKKRGLLERSVNGFKTPTGNSLAPTPIPSRGPSPAPSESSQTSETEADGGPVGRETRRRLVEWWTREYCASRMSLCVIGKESVDELSDMVAEMFSPILNRGRDALPMINDHPFGQNEMGTLVSVQTIMDFHALEISFPLDYQPPNWRHKPASFLAHFTGHEGPGSLHSYLKNKGWITGLSSGAQNLARGFGMFKITAYLTTEGFQNHREITLATFKYLNLLRSSPFPSWNQSEISTIASTRFRFSEKKRPDDYAVWLAEHMSWPVPRELVISAPQLTWPWDEKDVVDCEGEVMCKGEREVREVLEGLKVEKGRVVLMAREQEHDKVAAPEQKEKGWESEPWYGTKYRVERFDDQFFKEASSPNDIPQLFLPGPNEFIPTNLDVDKREVAEPLQRPHLIRETPLSSLWHKKDDQFWVPKARVIIEIRSPFANASPKASVMSRLFTDLVVDSLTEFSYDADLAGLSYNFASHPLGVFVALSGYNDKLPLLARHVLESVKNLKVDPERLNVMKEEVKRQWQNFFLGQSYTISEYYGRYLITEKQWTLQEKLPEIAAVTPEEIQAHAEQLLSTVNIRMLVLGNMYKSEAIGIVEMAENILAPKPIAPSDVLDRSLLLPPACNYIWATTVPNPNEPNSSLTYYLHLGSLLDQHFRVVTSLLAQILSEPAFNVLRTKEQLGYIVSCSAWHLAGESEKGLRLVVQSEKPPPYLEERVEAFLGGMKKTIEEMSDEEFQEQKKGLERKWTEKPKNIGEETNRYWGHIDSGFLDFLRRAKDAEVLQSVTKDDVLSIFLSHIHPSSPNRSKLSVHLRSQKPPPKKVGLAARTAFKTLVKESTIPVDQHESGEEEFADDEEDPLITDFAKHWHGLLAPSADPETMKKLLLEIPKLVEQHPVQGEGEDNEGTQKREGVTYIEDVKAFKASLKPSGDPKPIVEWGDLPLSKF